MKIGTKVKGIKNGVQFEGVLINKLGGQYIVDGTLRMANGERGTQHLIKVENEGNSYIVKA